MDGQVLSGLSLPASDTEAASKGYVDGMHFYREVTLAAGGWSASAPFKQTLAVEGILATDRPHYGVTYDADPAAAMAQKEAFAKVDDLDTADGSVTFTCLEEKPEVNIPIQLEVNR